MTKKAPRSRAPTVQTAEPASLGRVGIIALIGFVVGVAWPRLAGVSLVPEAPVDDTSEAALTAAQPEDLDAQMEPEVIELTAQDRLGIGPPKITSCADANGKKMTDCDQVAVDDLVHPHLIALLGCGAAGGVFGTLSLGFQLDFAKGAVDRVESGRSTDLPSATTQELLRCAEKELSAVELAGVPHQHSLYQVYYLLEFKTPEAAAEDKTSVTPASGQATVQWGTALVRKEPDSDGAVQARILAGARVLVTGRMGPWFRIKYDAKGREGWVHGNALGLGSDK